MSQNTDELFEVHKDEGYKYSSYDMVGKEYQFNDSESLGYEIAKFIENKEEVKSCGPAAFFMIQVDKKTKQVKRIFFGRNDSNPLNIHQSPGSLTLSSEGKGAEVEKDMLFSFNPNSKKMKVTKTKMVLKHWEDSPAVETWDEHKPTAEDLTVAEEYVPLTKQQELREEAEDLVTEYFLTLETEEPYDANPRDITQQLNVIFKEARSDAEDAYLDAELARDLPHQTHVC